MSGYRETIAAALAAAHVRSATSFAWFGAVHGDLPAQDLDDETARQYLRYLLQNELYMRFYCSGGPVAATSRSPRWMPPGAGAQLVEALSAANAGTGSLEPGWRVVRREDGRLVVERAGLTLWIDPRDAEGGDGTVRIRLPKELRRLNPGFYMALGDSGLDERDAIVRFYWHVIVDAAPALVGELTRSLNGAGLPFRLKVCGAPDRYDRCDAGVLYVRRDDYAGVHAHVARTHARVREHLLPATPALTKALAPGLAVAEDPGDGQSFGMHRCGLLAEAIAGAHEDGDTAGIEHVAAVFAGAGIELDRPFLNAGSEDVYALR
jgi:class II lanthipeptide synthase